MCMKSWTFSFTHKTTVDRLCKQSSAMCSLTLHQITQTTCSQHVASDCLTSVGSPYVQTHAQFDFQIVTRCQADSGRVKDKCSGLSFSEQGRHVSNRQSRVSSTIPSQARWFNNSHPKHHVILKTLVCTSEGTCHISCVITDVGCLEYSKGCSPQDHMIY